MRDRLSSLKFYRKLRNLSFSLSAIFFFLAIALIFNSLGTEENYAVTAIVFGSAAFIGAFVALYAHGRFRSRD